MTEKEFQSEVLDLAKMYRWRAYHTHDSRRSEPGFPDLVLLRPPVILFVELKTEKGRVTPEQAAFLGLLRACGQETRLWRPSMTQEIANELANAGR